MGAAAGEVYLAAVEAVLVFYIAVFTERSVLLIPAAVIEYIASTIKVAAILVTIEISAVIKSAFAMKSAAFHSATIAVFE
jgi:hypothetical protein